VNVIADNPLIYLCLSTVFFVLGIVCMLSRKNTIGLLLGVELLLNSAALNFVTFQAFNQGAQAGGVDGYVMALFIIVMAAIEAAISFAIVIRYFRDNKHVDPDRATLLRG